MTQHCMKSYTQLLIKTCHRRGVHAMGGMAAHIPIRNDPVANQVLCHMKDIRSPLNAISLTTKQCFTLNSASLLTITLKMTCIVIF